MSSPSHRAPLILLLIVAAGLGVRGFSERDGGGRGGEGTSAAASLDSQLSRVRAAANRAPKSKRSSKSATPKKSTAPKEQAIRSELTPYGAMPAELLAVPARRSSTSVRGRRLTEPSASIVDLETASAREIESLPRIGPALAKRIVDERSAHGAFRSLEGLQRVRGVGPALARLLEGRVTFNDARRP
ncbi:MAG: helix-hairpin-helix domain-containing protein [Gemmatimonadota bacterium]